MQELGLLIILGLEMVLTWPGANKHPEKLFDGLIRMSYSKDIFNGLVFTRSVCDLIRGLEKLVASFLYPYDLNKEF